MCYAIRPTSSFSGALGHEQEVALSPFPLQKIKSFECPVSPTVVLQTCGFTAQYCTQFYVRAASNEGTFQTCFRSRLPPRTTRIYLNYSALQLFSQVSLGLVVLFVDSFFSGYDRSNLLAQHIRAFQVFDIVFPE